MNVRTSPRRAASHPLPRLASARIFWHDSWPMPCRRAFLALALLLSACGQPDPSFVHIGDYEGAVGEAIVRHMVKTMPDLMPGIPREYCVVTGTLFKAERPHAVETAFTKRMEDLGVRFISADVLVEAPPNHDIIDPITRISPYVIQLSLMRRPEPTRWEVDVGWSFLKTYERKRFEVRTDSAGKVTTVTELQRVEGNYTPGQTSATPPPAAPAPQPPAKAP